MRKFGVLPALALSIGIVSASFANGQTPTPTPPAPTGCTPDTTLQVSDTMGSAPDMSTGTGVVAWKSTQPFTIAFNPQNGNNPYPRSQVTTANGTYWGWSCAMASGMTSPITYTITFTTSGKTINGRIIIKKK